MFAKHKNGLIVIALLVAVFFGVHYAAEHGLLPANVAKVLAPGKFTLPDVADAKVPNVKPAAYPSEQPANLSVPVIRAEIWEWNAQLGWILANGGAATTKGSLMAAANASMLLLRQDDTNQMVKDLIACAKQIKDQGGAGDCTSGANLIDIMGDQAAEVAAQANPQLEKLGPDYKLKLINSVGYSRGEDACMMPETLKDNPHSIAQTNMEEVGSRDSVSPAHGFLVAMSPHEGDWNICMKWAGDNGLKNNPDPHTFDQSAINILEEPDYNTAAADYVAGKCEDRKEVADGKFTGKTLHVCINGVATWTPGDVTVATKRGGLVKGADSLMYRSQMPSVWIGSGHWLQQNKAEVERAMKASWQGADQVKAFDAALHKAAAISSKLYNDEGDSSFHNGDYWYHYFHPVLQKDAQGVMVSLGGSAVNNQEDNAILFGFDGYSNNMAATYNIFRTINLQQYPEMYKAGGATPLPEAKDVIDRTFVKDLLDQATNDGGDDQAGAKADVKDYSQAGTGQQVSSRSYSITFATGQANLLPEGEATLAQIKDSITITGLKVKIDGYTDNTGSEQTNQSLSEARARTVQTWLQQHARRDFPASRFISVSGHGSAEPVADNATAQGKAQNRRVAIALVN